MASSHRGMRARTDDSDGLSLLYQPLSHPCALPAALGVIEFASKLPAWHPLLSTFTVLSQGSMSLISHHASPPIPIQYCARHVFVPRINISHHICPAISIPLSSPCAPRGSARHIISSFFLISWRSVPRQRPTISIAGNLGLWASGTGTRSPARSLSHRSPALLLSSSPAGVKNSR